MQNNNSKINTILLIILIILALGIIWIQWHDRKAEEGKDSYINNEQTSNWNWDTIEIPVQNFKEFRTDNVYFRYNAVAEIIESHPTDGHAMYKIAKPGEGVADIVAYVESTYPNQKPFVCDSQVIIGDNTFQICNDGEESVSPTYIYQEPGSLKYLSIGLNIPYLDLSSVDIY